MMVSGDMELARVHTLFAMYIRKRASPGNGWVVVMVTVKSAVVETSAGDTDSWASNAPVTMVV